MKKALTITLNKLVFYIEEDAYHRLQAYLESIKKTFASSADKDEIVADIEARIAERFTAATGAAKQAISIEDVEALIRTMGTSEDIGSAQSPHAEEKKGSKPLKKLYRDPDNRIIAGVASGIAAYFGIDPLYVRITFVVLAIFTKGLAVPVYLLLWLIVPQAQLLSQKMEMQGDPVTLKNLEEAVKARVENIDKEKMKKPGGKLANAIRAVFEAFGKIIRAVLRKVAPVVRVLLGTVILLAGIAGIIAATVGIIGFLINTPDPRMDPDFIRFVFSIKEQYFALAMGAVFVAAVVPMTLLFLSGISLLRKKNTISGPTLGVLLSLWMAALIATGVTLAYVIPRFEPSRNWHDQYDWQEYQLEREFEIGEIPEI
jgi:phage shock protein PspC (stress-responsive transcriptional regulator)